MQQIEIIYVIIFAIITLFTILAYTRKMSTGIALASALTGIGVAWGFSPYMELLIRPLGNVIFYNYAWTLLAFMVLINIILLFLLVSIRGYNLSQSGGKIGWA